ncbi:MAG: type II secretion system F family protein [Candidatus Methylacidiphilales bacterium]|nr:type II secretion system F family protein [Candidatus Methylacidiphilales bacterium]
MSPLLIITFFLLTGAFICIAAAFTTGESKPVSLTARLQKGQQGEAASQGGLRDAEQMNKGIVARVFLPLSNKWSKKFAGFTPAKMVADADQAIAEAGMIGQLTGAQLTTLSWMLAAAIPLLFAFLFTPAVLQGTVAPILLLAVCGIGALLGQRLPVGIIRGRANKRKHEISLALPFTFDLISISVSAGMAFDGAMQIVAERTKGPLAEEMRRTLREINLGIARSVALNNLVKRTGVEDLRTFIAAVNYIAKLGGSLTGVIEIQTEAMRLKRRQRAETKANQAPVKIMIPLVLFILPCLFIVILGPAALQLVNGKFAL